MTEKEPSKEVVQYLKKCFEYARQVQVERNAALEAKRQAERPGTKIFSVLCPVHHLWAFEVEATDHKDALRVFQEHNKYDSVFHLRHYETHAITDSPDNILEPIEVRCESEDDREELEIDTGYIKFLKTQNRDLTFQEIDPETKKPKPYWYQVDFGLVGGLQVCATSEAEARERAADQVEDIDWDLGQDLDEDSILAVERQDEADEEDYDN